MQAAAIVRWLSFGSGCLCGGLLIAGATQLLSERAGNGRDLLARVEQLELATKVQNPALIFVGKPVNEPLTSTHKEFDVASLLSDQPDGFYIICGSIRSPDATGSPPQNVLMNRLQFSEILVAKSGAQIDCFMKCAQYTHASGQGIELDNTNGKIIMSNSGNRQLELWIWRFADGT